MDSDVSLQRADFLARGGLFVAVGLVMVLAFGLMPYAHPLGDDFEFRHFGMTLGSWGTAYHHYFSWSGRWATRVVECGLLPHLVGYRYGAALTVLSLVEVLASFAAVRLVFQRSVGTATQWGLAGCLWALHWASMPAPAQTTYWFTGAVENQLSLSLAMLCVASAGVSQPRGRWLVGVWLLALSLLIVAVTGLHEVTGIQLAIVLGVATGISFHTGSPKRFLWLLLLTVCLLGVAAAVLAPGNAARATAYAASNSRSVIRTLGLTAKFLARDVLAWMVDPRLICASLCLILSPRFTRLRIAWMEQAAIRWNYLVPALTLALIALGAAAVAFGTGQSPPERTENLLHMVFLLGWFCTLLLWSRCPEYTLAHRSPLERFLPVSSLALLAVGLLASGNANIALRDLDKRILPWHAAMLERDELMKCVPQGTDLVLPQTPPMPAIFFQCDLAPHNSWQNNLFARCYGLASARVESEGERAARIALVQPTSSLR